jgi:hypothetical protein
MSCGCKKIETNDERKFFEGICDVCRLIDKNEELKQVYHCDMCNANICDRCHPRYDKRALAAIISKLK